MKTMLLLVAIGSFAFGYAGGSSQAARPPGHAGFLLDELRDQAENAGLTYYPFLDRSTLSAGLYRLPAGGTDRQSPHELDEVYFVAAGRSAFTAGESRYDVEPGTVLFVARDVPHGFHDIEEDLEVLVFFSKARDDDEE